MTLISSSTRLVGAVALTLGSVAAFATTPDTLFQIGVSGKPAALHADNQGNLYRAQRTDNGFSTPITLAKIAADGSPAWEVTFDGYNQNYAFDGNGVVYVTENKFISFLRTDVGKIFRVDASGQKQVISPGLYSQTGFGAYPLLDVSDQQQLLAAVGKHIRKFNADGTLAWETTVSQHSRYGLTDIEVDHAGNVYTTYFSWSYAPQGVVYGTKLHKRDPNGNLIWVQHLPYRVGTDAIHINSQNELIILSKDSGTALYKLDANGNQLHSQTVSGMSVEKSQLDGQGNLVLVGNSGGAFAVRQLDSDLTELWTTKRPFVTASGGNYGAYVQNMAIGEDDSIYVTGAAKTGRYWTNRRVATVKFDSAGNEVWAAWESGSGAYFGMGSQIAVQGSDAYVTALWHSGAPEPTWFLKYGSLNQPPVADAGFYLPQECSGQQTSVLLDGTASNDPDGDTLSYSWSGPFGVATGATPSVSLPLGDHPVTLNVDDGNGGTSTATVTIRVQDTTPPVVDAGSDRVLTVLNAAGAPFTPDYSALDACGAVSVAVEPLLSSYPIGNNLLTVTATDASGNVGSDTMTLTVAYSASDFLPPLKANGVYKLGRTLPVKFQLFYADGSIASGATPTLSLQQMSNNEPVGEPIDPQSSATAEPTNAFRFADDQYIYNLDTSALSTGGYRLLVDLGDGNGYKTIDIGFK